MQIGEKVDAVGIPEIVKLRSDPQGARNQQAAQGGQKQHHIAVRKCVDVTAFLYSTDASSGSGVVVVNPCSR